MNEKISILMFSGDYDKALAALILANTAMEINVDVTIFFAFWGLTLVRNPEAQIDDNKSMPEKIMANMTARSIEEAPLSRMNMAGIGKKMLEGMMEDNDTPTIEAFLKGALKKGVKMKACKLSCEIMGFGDQELLPDVEIITAEDYLKDALKSKIQLFI